MTRLEFVERFVDAKVAAWFKCNTHSSPFGTSKPHISPQHVESFRRMGEDAADAHLRSGGELADVAEAPISERDTVDVDDAVFYDAEGTKENAT